MPKEKPREIEVIAIFDGKQDERQAFVELILQRLRCEPAWTRNEPLTIGTDYAEKHIDCGSTGPYTHNKVFSDIHADRKEKDHEQSV